MDVAQVFSKLPSFGIGFAWTNLVQKTYKNEFTQAVVKAETPFDLYIELTNLLAKIPGMDLMKIDRTNGLLISWNEMNEIWLESFKSFKKFPTWAVQILKKSN